jgi:hypothetical protein
LYETFDGMMATKYKLVGNGSIGSINVVPPNFQHKAPIPFFKFIYNPTLSHGKKVVTKAKPIIKVIVRYLNTSTRSQCIYLKLLLATS